MDLEDYNKVKDFKYREYCDYLIKKYGAVKGPYYNTNWNKNRAITRTSEGLYIHHIYEDHAIMLGDVHYAVHNPYEWQLGENLVYCDLLEHLFLHILIVENPSPDKNVLEDVGTGGVINFIAPELNDVYSGWKTKQPWREKCHSLIINSKDLYLVLIKRFENTYSKNPNYVDFWYARSFNEMMNPFNSEWTRKNDRHIFEEIDDYLYED